MPSPRDESRRLQTVPRSAGPFRGSPPLIRWRSFAARTGPGPQSSRPRLGVGKAQRRSWARQTASPDADGSPTATSRVERGRRGATSRPAEPRSTGCQAKRRSSPCRGRAAANLRRRRTGGHSLPRPWPGYWPADWRASGRLPWGRPCCPRCIEATPCWSRAVLPVAQRRPGPRRVRRLFRCCASFRPEG